MPIQEWNWKDSDGEGSCFFGCVSKLGTPSGDHVYTHVAPRIFNE